MNSPDKQRLLRNYAEGTPTDYFQFDAFQMGDAIDSIMHADEDGHCLMGGTTTTELRRSGVDVRVQIKVGTNAKDALAMLEKIVFQARQQVETGRNRESERSGYSKQRLAEMSFPDIHGEVQF